MSVHTEVEKLDACTSQMKVEIDVEETREELLATSKAFAKKAKLPGFRKGKVPLEVARRVFAKEIRDVLEHTNFSDEIADVLTKLSFEINTQVRFVPNPQVAKATDATAGDEDDDANAAGSGPAIPRPRVVSKVVVKARDKLDRHGKD